MGFGALYRFIISCWKFAFYLDRVVIQKFASLIGLFRVRVSPRRLSRRLTN